MKKLILVFLISSLYTISKAQVPLNLYWSEERTDNATMAGEAEQWAKGSNYKLALNLGSILKDPTTGTIPLNLYWSEARKDNATMAGEAEKWARDANYTFARTLGYIFKTQVTGTIPLKLYWSDERKDNATMAGEAEQWAKDVGYKMAKTLGFIYPPAPVSGTKLSILFQSGDDDLRESATITVRLTDNTEVNCSGEVSGLSSNNTGIYTFTFRSASGVRRLQNNQIKGITINFDGRGDDFGETGDNWDLAKIKVDFVADSGTKLRLYENSSGSVFRFTEHERNTLKIDFR